MARSNIYGFSGFNKNQNSTVLNNSKLNTNNKGLLIPARVISIVLDKSHPRWAELGGWNAVGAIEYNSTDTPSYNSNNYSVAYPLNSNIKHFPLKNETVLITSTFSSAVNLFEENLNIIGGESKKYYTNIINIWNHPHHNGYSFKINSVSFLQNKTYNQTQAGSINNTPDEPIQIDLGNTFKEKSDIHPLQPFEGDIIYEGRWGNSIRFSSTVKDTSNNWSLTGDDGDPITIIRNGQGIQTNEGWEPIIENINNDESSIYLTTSQNISLEASSTNYDSYKIPPQKPKFYNQPQIILNSGRLVFNTYEDHILLTSAKSINLNSFQSINVDSPNFIVQANKIYLGKNEANEPLMLGTQTVNLLTDLIKVLHYFMTITSNATTNICVEGQSVTLPTINLAASDVLDVLNDLKFKLENKNLVSERNFTI